MAKARLDFERAKTLKTRDQLSAISQADYDTAKTTLATATAGLEATHASLEAARAHRPATLTTNGFWLIPNS